MLARVLDTDSPIVLLTCLFVCLFVLKLLLVNHMLYSFMNRPFAVDPVSSVIPVNGMLQVSVEFQPLTVGEHVGQVIVHYDSGRLAVFMQSLC